MKSFSLVFLRFYVKLQDAYVSESNKVGSWKLIGYVAPGSTSAATEGSTTNFAYTAGSEIDVDQTSAVAIDGFDAVTWQAKNLVALNECAIDDANVWTVTTKAADNGNSVTYEAEVPSDCLQLTPSFTRIGK